MKKPGICTLLVVVIALWNVSCKQDYTPKEKLPIAYINFSMESDNDFRVPTTITFINLSTIDSVLGEPEFIWDFGNGVETPNMDDTIEYTYAVPGDYEITLIAKAPKMESDTFRMPLTIKYLYEYIFTESFEAYAPDEITGDNLTNSWVVIDNDGGTPGNPVLFDKAWKVVYNPTFNGNVAVANSYNVSTPVPDADDWMISPEISLSETDSFTIEWKAMSLTKSGNWPDSYQVYLSNTSQDIAGCTHLIKEVKNEWWALDASNIAGKGIHSHKLDISEFTGDTVHVGFRLMTPAPGGSQLAIDSIRVTRYYKDKSKL